MIQEIHNQKEWKSFVNACAPHTFLQTWQWGEFHTALGEKVFRLGISNGGELLGAAHVIKISARRGNFLFIPHGPLYKRKLETCLAGRRVGNWKLEEFVNKLRVIATRENCSFIRISPLLEDTPENRAIFFKLGFRSAPIHMHSEIGWILDISPSEEELLKGMRKTTRHAIRNAQKAGVKIVQSNRVEDADVFYKVYEATVQEKHFIPFSKTYIQKEFETFAKDDMVQWFFAMYNENVLSAALIIFTGESGFYHQGANSRLYPNIPASQLLQWEVIRETKKRGLLWYNFWGISPDNKPDHPWAGTTRFKKGFGGFSQAYVHAQDLVLSPKYWLNWGIETIRKIKRGYI